MTIDEVKQTIEQRTGVPASLLTGETAEENIAQAKAILAYKREHEQQRGHEQPPAKTTREQFADWFNAQVGGADPHDTAGAALAEIEEAARVAAGGYPMTRDGGEVDGGKMPDGRTTREQFAGWFNNKTAFNPFSGDGWKTL